MASKEDIVLSLGFDLSSVPKAISTLQSTLKNQKLIANIAFQFGTSQGEVRNQLKKTIDNLNADAKSNPVNLDIGFDDLPRTRYALYDVSNLARQASDALISVGTASVKAAAEFESAFTNVERTTFSNVQLLKQVESQLNNLAREIPLTFGDLSGIASLGAQLGIATGDLAGFTETVAQFSAVSNVTSESAAQSFGAIGQLLDVSADQYQNLGSAIAQVGVNSIATESEILSVATQIGGVAASAGLSADYVVGLSGALASLRVPAEQSRGALTRTFQEINRAAAEGGPAMQNFANVLGISTEEATRLAKTNVEEFFSKFISGLSRLDSTSLTSTLDALGLSELRVTNTLTRLSRNTDLLAQTQADSNSAFEDGTFLAAAYALKVDDVSSKFAILQNSFQEFIAKAGEPLLPIVGAALDALSNVLQNISDALSTDAGKWAAGITVGTVAAVGGFLSLVSTIALVTAGLFALRTALNGLGWTAAMGGARGLAAAFVGVGLGADAAAIKTARLATALKTTVVFAVIGALYALQIAYNEAGKSAEIAFNKFTGGSAGLADALSRDTAQWKEAVESGNTQVAESFQTVEYAGTALETAYSKATEKVSNAATVVGKDIPEAFSYANGVINEQTRAIGDNTLAWVQNSFVQSEAFQNAVSGFSDVQNAFLDWDASIIGYENLNFTEFFEVLQEQAGSLDFKELSALAVEGGSDAVYEEFERMVTAAYQGGQLTIDQIANIDYALAARIGMASENTADQINGWIINILNGFVNAAPGFKQLLEFFGIKIPTAVSDISNSLGGFGDAVRITEVTTSGLNNTLEDTETGFNNAGKAASGAAKKIYLLTDYASDLSSIWSRAFDIRFSAGETLDKITKSFSDLAKATADARQEIAELNADIQTLQADQALQEYFLTVAEAYGDTLKAQEIRANLAKIDADLTKKTKALEKAQDKTNKTLVGSSDAAVENRKDILNLVKGYQEHVKALAASGLKEDELRAKAAQLKAEFIAQATQLGYNSEELGIYAAAFDDVTAAINAVPRDLTVDFNGDPALTAIDEFVAKAKQRLGGGGSFPVKVVSTEQRRLKIDSSDYPLYLRVLRNGGMSPQQFDRAVWEYYSEGGYTGAGGKYDIAGIVHRGEYVVPKNEVNQVTKKPYFMEQPRTFAAGGFTGQSGPTMVMLSPEDRSLLRNAGGSGNVVLYADGKELARTVNDGNRQIVAQGGRP
jgi:TP901 family phage tail tape measure protein